MIADDDEFAKIKPPITDAQLCLLQPLLESIAAKYAKCYNERMDYLSEANIALLTKKNWSHPVVCAESAMKDFQRSRRSGNDLIVQSFGEGEGEWDVDSLIPDWLRKADYTEMCQFTGLDLDPRERKAAQLYYAEGLTQDQVAEEMGIPQMTVSNMLRRVKAAVAAVWLEKEPKEAE